MIFLYILLGIIGLIVLFLFSDLALRIDYREQLKLTLYVWGIPLDFPVVYEKLQKLRRGKHHATDYFRSNAASSEEKKKKANILHTLEDLYSFLCALGRGLRAVAEGLQKHLKIRVRKLNVRVGSSDAAATAMRYGEINALLSALFAFLEQNCRFVTRKKSICITPDFESNKSSLDLHLTLYMKPFFVWTTYSNMYLEFYRDLLELMELEAMKTNAQNKKGTKK